jgi:cytochrome c556
MLLQAGSHAMLLVQGEASMFRTSVSRLVVTAAVAGLLAACSGEAPTDGASEVSAKPAEIAERQKNFKAIADAFKAVRGELELDTPDFAVIAAQAGEINTLAQQIEGLFPAGTSMADGHDTEALPAIWEKPEEFSAAATKLVDESASLMTLAAGGDKAAVGAQAMAMGGACKGCHDNFRLDKK